MYENDLNYYRRRAEDELRQAQQATTAKAVKAHCDLADAYLERVAAAEPCGERV